MYVHGVCTRTHACKGRKKPQVLRYSLPCFWRQHLSVPALPQFREAKLTSRRLWPTSRCLPALGLETHVAMTDFLRE